MSHRFFAALVLALPLFAACDALSDALPELTFGKEDGVPPISGSTTIDLPQDYVCGDPITDPASKYKVTSSGTQDKCTFTFDQDVTALKASDYANKPEMEGARFVKQVDIEVTKLGVKDGTTGEPVTPLDLNGKAFGTTILTMEDLKTPPPFTKTVEGAPVEALKSKIEAKQDIVIPIQVQVVVNMAPTPPAKIGLEFDAQPNIVIGF